MDNKDYQKTHWGRVMHICVGKLTIIGSDNGLSPERRQAIIWTKLQWNFNQNSNIFIQENAFENVICEMTSILSRPQCVNRKRKRRYGFVFITLSNFLKTYTLPYSWASHWKLIQLLTRGIYKTDDVVVTQTIIKGYYIEYQSTSGRTWTRLWTHQRHRISGPRAWAMISFVRIWEGEYWQGYNWTRGHFVHAPSQWEMALDCNTVTYRLGTYPG